MVHFGAFALLGFEFAMSIDSRANAYRLRRLMLQSHSRTLFLLFLELAFGFFDAEAGVHFQEVSEVVGQASAEHHGGGGANFLRVGVFLLSLFFY